MRTPTVALLVVAAFLAALPASASAGKRQAWDVQAVAGSYTITGAPLEQTGCPATESTPDQQVLSSKYEVAFEGTGVSGRGPWIKYFPYLRGPASPGPVGVKFAVEMRGTENVRTVDAFADAGCSVTDKPCAVTDTAKTGKGTYAIGAETSGKTVRVGLPIIGSSSFLLSCEDEADGHFPEYEGRYSGSISPFIEEKVPVSAFKKGSLVIAYKGTQPVKGKGRGFFGWTGKLSWSAKLKLKKVVLSEGCKETKGSSGFVCSP